MARNRGEPRQGSESYACCQTDRRQTLVVLVRKSRRYNSDSPSQTPHTLSKILQAEPVRRTESGLYPARGAAAEVNLMAAHEPMVMELRKQESKKKILFQSGGSECVPPPWSAAPRRRRAHRHLPQASRGRPPGRSRRRRGRERRTGLASSPAPPRRRRRSARRMRWCGGAALNNAEADKGDGDGR
jgi:hypothetical protein